MLIGIHALWKETLKHNISEELLNMMLQKAELPKAGEGPYIFEFLGISNTTGISENKIETALINHLQQFLMELGVSLSVFKSIRIPAVSS